MNDCDLNQTKKNIEKTSKNCNKSPKYPEKNYLHYSKHCKKNFSKC